MTPEARREYERTRTATLRAWTKRRAYLRWVWQPMQLWQAGDPVPAQFAYYIDPPPLGVDTPEGFYLNEQGANRRPPLGGALK